MTVFGISEKGNYRDENQDSILMRSKGSSGLFLVADGVGGSAKGLKASESITERYAVWWETRFLKTKGRDFFAFFDEIKGIAEQINSELCERYGAGRSCSTVALLFIYRGTFGYLSSGDSRIYRCNRAGARLITRDDVWENRFHADLRPENIGKLISAVGGYDRLEYSCATDRVKFGEIFVLCSDGIYRFVGEQIMTASLKKMYGRMILNKHIVEELVGKAVDNDTRDNYSLIAVKV